MLRKISLALGILPGLSDNVAAQSPTPPEITVLNIGPCRQLTVRDRPNNAMVPLGCLDTSSNALDVSGVKVRPRYGSTIRDLSEKLAEILSVSDFGADPTGASDSTSAFNAGIKALAGRGGGRLTYCGTFRVSQIVVSTSNIHLEGCGYDSAVLVQVGANRDTISFAGAAPCCDVQNVSIQGTTIKPASGVTRTNGAAIRCAFTYRCNVIGNRIEMQFVGVELYGAGGGRVWYNYILNTVTPASGSFSMGLWDHGIAASNSVANDILGNNVDGSTKPSYGFYIGGGVQGELIHFNNGAHARRNLYVTTATGTTDPAESVVQMFFMHNAWDTTAQRGATRADCSTAENTEHTATFQTDGVGPGLATFNIVGDWYASSTCGTGLRINALNGPINNLRLIGPQVLNNFGHGIWLSGTALSNVDIEAAQVFGNSAGNGSTLPYGTYHGINIDAGVTHLSIRGGRARPGSFYPNSQGYGVVLQAGASDYIRVRDMDNSGNLTGSVLNLSTGTHNDIANNF